MSLRARAVPAGAIEPSGINDIISAMNALQPGESLVYHRGHLDTDRRGKSRFEREVNEIAARAYDQATGDRPRLHLTQFRQNGRGFAYVATGRGNRPARMMAA